jgi:hypothetical protein
MLLAISEPAFPGEIIQYFLAVADEMSPHVNTGFREGAPQQPCIRWVVLCH